MAEKIIFLTTASLEEDLADGKVLDAGQVKAIYERYGEDETTQYIMEDFKVNFDAIDVKEVHLVREIDGDAKLSDFFHGYMAIESDGNLITLSSLLDEGNTTTGENHVKCKKVKVNNNDRKS